MVDGCEIEQDRSVGAYVEFMTGSRTGISPSIARSGGTEEHLP